MFIVYCVFFRIVAYLLLVASIAPSLDRSPTLSCKMKQANLIIISSRKASHKAVPGTTYYRAASSNNTIQHTIATRDLTAECQPLLLLTQPSSSYHYSWR